MLMNQENSIKWLADWIWLKGTRETPDCYFYARKSFNLKDEILTAKLHISAYTNYILYINGNYVGRGPSPSIPKHQYFDTYDIQQFLVQGENTISVLAHNFGIGMHWQAMGPGGLIVQAEILTKSGVEYITTDGTWKVKRAKCYLNDSPRMMWPSQFVETFDARLEPEGWRENGFVDSAWLSPELLGKHPVYPWEYLIPREIPQLEEKLDSIIKAQGGEFEIKGYHSISFKGIGESQNCLIYARTKVHSETARELLLNISCDDAFKVFFNGEVAVSQLYDDSFVRTTMWNLREDYEQFHYGQGVRNEEGTVQLKKGWNDILVVVDKATEGWGFGLGFLEKANNHLDSAEWTINARKYEVLRFSSKGNNDIEKCTETWTVSGPFESTGLKNSLDKIVGSEFPEGTIISEYDSKNHNVITDYSCLMRAEERTGIKNIDNIKEIMLSEGEFIIAEFDAVKAGIPMLTIETEADSIIDIGYGNILPRDKKITFMWNMRYVDRIYTGTGTLNWQTHWMRECRYYYISCRKGKNVKLQNMSIKSIAYPVEEKGSFACSDEVLNQIYKTSVYTTKMLMQHDYMDCMKREGSTHNQRSFIHASMGALNTFGDHQLIRKNILNAIRTQDESGWFNSHGASDNNADEPTQLYWWVELLQKYDLYSGDTDLIKSLYQQLKGLLRYFSRLENKDMLIDSRNENKEVRNRICYIDDQSDYGGIFIGIFEGMLLTFNILYYGALNSAVYLAEKTGNMADATKYKKKAAYLKKSINKTFWDTETDMYVSWVKESGNAGECGLANIIAALYYDVCEEDKKERVLYYLCETLGGNEGKFENYHLSFGFFFFFIEVLFKNKKEDLAFEFWRKFFGRWKELDVTTFTENLGLMEHIGATEVNLEYNTHGYGTAVLVRFYSDILGIKPLDTGFKRISIEPHTGDLEWAKGELFTPLGMITVNWKVIGGEFIYDVRVPEGCSYEIKLPQKYKHSQFFVNGKEELL